MGLALLFNASNEIPFFNFGAAAIYAQCAVSLRTFTDRCPGGAPTFPSIRSLRTTVFLSSIRPEGEKNHVNVMCVWTALLGPSDNSSSTTACLGKGPNFRYRLVFNAGTISSALMCQCDFIPN
jgi:hypothetical protein